MYACNIIPVTAPIYPFTCVTKVMPTRLALESLLVLNNLRVNTSCLLSTSEPSVWVHMSNSFPTEQIVENCAKVILTEECGEKDTLELTEVPPGNLNWPKGRLGQVRAGEDPWQTRRGHHMRGRTWSSCTTCPKAIQGNNREQFNTSF